MATPPKILLLDDDLNLLEVYREMLSRHLTCQPEVKTANSGPRALALMESEPCNLLILDLNMPKMDGLQVLSIARRKYPELRVVVLTGLRDEQFRTRAYAIGVDQYWIKPESEQEMSLFIESIQSLVSREAQGGFRGVQSKSLVDIIQLECLSQSSCLLRITNGVVEGRIWIESGEVVDAETGLLTAEPAFQRILGWKTGSFEMLPPDSTRTRSIFTSYQGLLLNTAQALDEAASQEPTAETGQPSLPGREHVQVLANLPQLEGVEFVVAVATNNAQARESWGLDDPKPVAEWLQKMLKDFQALGERLQVGHLQQIVGTGPHRKVAMLPCGGTQFCLGFPPNLPAEQVRETIKTVVTQWAS